MNFGKKILKISQMSWNWCLLVGKLDFWAKSCSRAKIDRGGGSHPPLHLARLPDVALIRVKVCSFLKVMMLSLFSVDNLPTTHESSFWGARALPSIMGNGAYVQLKKYFYELVCSSTACQWNIMEKQLTTGVYNAVMMYLPQDYTC